MININPNLKDFIKLAKRNNLIVLSHKLYSDWLTPVSIYYSLMKKIKGESFLLESVEGEEKISRFSFLGFMPIVTFKSKGKTIYLKNAQLATFITEKDPLSELKKVMKEFRVAPRENLRFFGGFVGYLGYDIIRFYEPVGKELPDSLKNFDSYFMLPKFLIIFDHLKRQIEILSFVTIKNKINLKKVYLKEKKILENMLKNIIIPHQLPGLSFTAPRDLNMKSNLTKHDFITKVNKAKQYIREGEIIQTVLSQRFSVDFTGNPFGVYRYLRILNPSPYMFYLNFNDVKVAGSSPEMLLRCEKEELITRPIAGTRKRGKDEKEERELAASLLNDPKERAEHIMLVDLARNDLGRVSEKASVSVPIFMTIERFSHVMHIVSEVRAKLRKHEDIFSSLRSCFPAGTVSGAPKVRAMQIINELEPQRRGIYAGSVGYFSFTNSLDTCIIIRTIVFRGNKAYIQAGAGIVADSKPQREYKETINKAKAQVLAVKLANQMRP
ncbi:MAG: anthranilate synthase component I [Candidatus Omnitrophota bacterium]|nr:anthranilate synthase component I [Candidatus Omnitrophota bacterium]